MGAWGPLLFQSDNHLDSVDTIVGEANLELWRPDDPVGNKAELENGKLNDLFDRYTASNDLVKIVFL